MSRLKDYAEKYSFAVVEREDGILTVRLHEDGKEFRWIKAAHRELSSLFEEISTDAENRVVILTGTGSVFCTEIGPPAPDAPAAPQLPPRPGLQKGGVPADHWNVTYTEGKRLLTRLLDIEVPVISAINGPAHIHAEMLVLSDVVLAAPHVTLQDLHMGGSLPLGSMVAGDGGHVVWPWVLGPNRGRYFLGMSQMLGAEEALSLGVINEIVPVDTLMDRAFEIARTITTRSPLVTRYYRVISTQPIKRLLLDDLGYGLALEGMAASIGGGVWDQKTPLIGER